jgi:HSP20 family protein
VTLLNRDPEHPRESHTLAPFFRQDLFAAMRREMGRLVGEVLAPIEARSFASNASESSWPSLDVHETDQTFVVDAEVPGLEPNDIELSLRDNVLIISGEKRQEWRGEKRSRAYEERFYGRFRRTLHFATDIDADNVEASFRSGVLTVRLPKNPRPEAKERRIEITPSEKPPSEVS